MVIGAPRVARAWPRDPLNTREGQVGQVGQEWQLMGPVGPLRHRRVLGGAPGRGGGLQPGA